MNDLHLDRKIVYIWMGFFINEESVYNYTTFNYDKNGDAYSAFENQIGIEWYDEDFMEVHFSENTIKEYLQQIKDSLLYSDSFIDDFMTSLSNINTDSLNSMIILYGKKDINSVLFDYINTIPLNNHPIQLVFKKEF